MCEQCAPANSAPAGGRRKLWEVGPNLHCSILGTCLSYADLLRTGRRAGYVSLEEASEYEVHKYFVRCAQEPERLARLMQKMLDAKYRTAIHASQSARCRVSLEAFWSDALARGDIPGPYWALATHPLVTDGLLYRAFGEVHMLSHLTGAANRADAKRLAELEAALTATKKSLASRAAEYRRAAERHARVERRLRAAETANAALAATETRLRDLQSGATFRSLERANAALEADLKDARQSGDRARHRCDSLERELSELRQAYGDAITDVEVFRSECSALETLLKADVDGGATHPPEGVPAIDLRGRRIAYIGGRAGAVGHFRAVVESLNGRFSHHDGGNDNIGRLGGILSQADVVLCPVDCVSHGACLKAKALCKQTAKPFVPLRTAGLSSLVRGLHQAAADDGKVTVLADGHRHANR